MLVKGFQNLKEKLHGIRLHVERNLVERVPYQNPMKKVWGNWLRYRKHVQKIESGHHEQHFQEIIKSELFLVYIKEFKATELIGKKKKGFCENKIGILADIL